MVLLYRTSSNDSSSGCVTEPRSAAGTVCSTVCGTECGTTSGKKVVPYTVYTSCGTCCGTEPHSAAAVPYVAPYVESGTLAVSAITSYGSSLQRTPCIP